MKKSSVRVMHCSGFGWLGIILMLWAVGQPGAQDKLYGLEKKLSLSTGLAIRKEVIVPATVDEVWQAWTTQEGVVTFFAPKASVELAVGGDYEMYFDPKQPRGQRGSEDCKILSFVPYEMLSFTWSAPPSMPAVRKERTWVVLFFRSLEEKKTQVTMVHLGWQVGEEWQKALQYFDKAWELVLSRLQYRFQTGPLNWEKPYQPRIGQVLVNLKGG